MRAIYKRELQSYMNNMTGCVFIAFLTAFVGIYFMALNLNYGYPYFSYTLSGVLFIMIIAVPVLTMRSFAEERKNRTDQLLLTSPVSVMKIVLGKFFSMTTILLIPTLIFCLFPLIIMVSGGTAYLKVDYCSILLFFLMGCVYISIGMFLSALTESQIIAVISTVGVLFLLYLWDSLTSFLPSSAISNALILAVIWTVIAWLTYNIMKNWIMALVIEFVGVAAVIITYVVKSSLFESLITTVMGNLSIMAVFSDVADNHILNVSGIVLYLSLTGLFIFLTMQSIQKRRWS